MNTSENIGLSVIKRFEKMLNNPDCFSNQVIIPIEKLKVNYSSIYDKIRNDERFRNVSRVLISIASTESLFSTVDNVLIDFVIH